MTLDELRAAIKADPENATMTDAGWEPLYTAGPRARIVVVGQAPGRKAQEAGCRGATRAAQSCATGSA
jgi:uracil-DNA glycosylase